MKICAFVVTAVFAPSHPEFENAKQKIYCFVSFPALNEDESIAKVGQILNEASLRLDHLEQFFVHEQDDTETGNTEFDLAMNDIRKSGRHLKTSKVPLRPIGPLRERKNT